MEGPYPGYSAQSKASDSHGQPGLLAMLSRLSDRTRGISAVVLIVLGAVLLFTGTIALYAREQVIDREAFADRALVALDDDGLRHLVGREIVVNAIERGNADLVAARPLLESVVDTVIQTDAFRRVFRAAALETNRIFFVRGKENALFDLGDAASVVQFALRSVSPKVAKQMPQDLKPQLLTLRRRKFAGATLSVADAVRPLGIVLPLLALLAFAGAVVVSPDRRIGVLRVGVATGVVGAVLAGALLILRARVLAGVVGEDEVTDEEVRDAVRGLLDAYVGDLVGWALLLALLGLVVAAAAAALDPEDVEDPVRRMRDRIFRRPRTTAGRAVRGLAALAGGIVVVLNPTLALQLLAIGAGALLVFFGSTELLVLLQRPGQTRVEGERMRKRALAAAGTAGAVVVGAAVALVVVVTSGGADPQAAERVVYSGKCNGSFGLCDVRLNEAVFAGTHNSMSAADSPGWFIANQRRTIERQLKDGIRLFLIDPHWGVRDENGKVRTDFKSEGRSRNKVAKAMPPDVLRSAERLAGRLGAGSTEGERDVWLCHTVCELGATPMVDALEVMRKFLDENRGEVIILFIEPYVSPADIAKVFERSGLIRYVVTLARDEPLPTLGQLVHRNRRVVVFTEKDADGTVPWYLDGFSFVQDTPLGATKVSQLRCTRERGTADSPIAMMNHWADLFPPRRQANVPFQREDVIIKRAHRCAKKLGVTVNLIPVDHYDVGDLIPAVDALNGERIQAVRREQAQARSG
jgi:uncharacterized membrane protein HdeD (DUF308 family)